MDRVIAFVGQPAISADLTATVQEGDRTLYSVSNIHLVALVEAVTGDVVSVLIVGAGRSSGDGPTADEAVATAETYLRDHGVNFDGMTRTVERIDHGETWEWAIHWVRMAGNIVLPDLVDVGVDPTGQVFRFATYRRPYTSPPTPTVDQEAAEAAASHAAFGDVPTQIDSTTLRLKVDEDGEQRLVWEIAVSAWAQEQPSGSEPMSHAIVEVDALTGAATVIGRG